jgi:hypothetical protein
MCTAPNQQLKLTEPSVDDVAAQQGAGIEKISGYVRAMNSMELPARRSSPARRRREEILSDEVGRAAGR